MQIDKDYPEAYKRGYILFCDLEIKVNEDVLIPRIETESIVDIVENYVRQNNLKETNILDVGTGSGCISIVLAKRIEDTQITAIDISNKALEVAKENVREYNLENRIEILQNDLLDNYNTPHDIIVSNLPYIPTDYIEKLDKSVKDFEPRIALDGGKEGFDLYRRLFKQIIDNNINPKLIVIELDDSHIDVALNEGRKYFPRYKIRIEKDKYNYGRFLVIETIL